MSAVDTAPGQTEADTAAGYKAMPRAPFVPMLLVAGAVLIWAVFQSVQLFEARNTLGMVDASQQKQIEQAQKLRAALNSLAADTQRLANGGNADAQLLVEQLRKRGVTINPNAPSAVPPPP